MVVKIVVRSGEGDHLYKTKPGEIFLRENGLVKGPLTQMEVQQWIERVSGVIGKCYTV
jgi:hypothetical protein